MKQKLDSYEKEIEKNVSQFGQVSAQKRELIEDIIDKAKRITITLPPDMLASIKKEVRSGSYGSTSELIREAMRMWQKREEEYKARIFLIRERLAHSEQSGFPERAWAYIEKLRLKYQKLETAPLRGQQRNDLMNDLRIYPFNKKTVAAFVVDEEQQSVRILNIFYGGRDYEAIMSALRT